MLDMPACFSPTADVATARFLEAAGRAGADIETFELDLLSPDKNGCVCVTVALGPSTSEKALVTVSGVHGDEGLPGAAIQLSLVEEPPAVFRSERIRTVHVHLINPWGTAWDHHADHENIDVFRNFVYPPEQRFENPGYDALVDQINPTEWTGPLRDDADRRLAAFVERHGPDELQKIARLGQNRHPLGLTYHGDHPSWSRGVLAKTAARHLRHAKRIFSMDIHTGFGSYGHGTPVSYDGPATPQFAALTKMFGELYYPGAFPLIPSHPRSALHLLQEFLPQSEHLTYALEFGTLDTAAMMDELRLGNWLFGREKLDTAEGVAHRRRVRAFFCPDDPHGSAWSLQKDGRMRSGASTGCASDRQAAHRVRRPRKRKACAVDNEAGDGFHGG